MLDLVVDLVVENNNKNLVVMRFNTYNINLSNNIIILYYNVLSCFYIYDILSI